MLFILILVFQTDSDRSLKGLKYVDLRARAAVKEGTKRNKKPWMSFYRSSIMTFNIVVF